jgi:hypothetical protein
MFDPYEQQIVGLQRQQETARKLREQAMQPIEGQMISGWYVKPSLAQGLGQALRLYVAQKQEDQATKGIEEAVNQRKAQRESWLSQMPKTQTQIEQLPSDVQGPPQSQVVQPKTEDYLNWATQGMNIDPQAAQMGMNFANLAEGRKDRAEMLKSRLDEARLARQEQLQARQDMLSQQFENQKELAKMNIQSRQDLARLAAALRPAPQAQSPVAVMGPDGKPIFVPPSMSYGRQPYNAASEAKQMAFEQQKKQNEISAQQALDQSAMLYAHPGRQAGTGMSSWMSNIPGTDARGFKANLDTFKAQTFVPMISALKGMGALTDKEGKTLMDSVGALDPTMKEKEFEDSLKRISNMLYEKAKASGLNVSLPEFANSNAVKSNSNVKFLGFE